MRARTPAEKLDALLTLRAKVDAQIKATLAHINDEPQPKRSRLIVPECGSETAYQRHMYYEVRKGDAENVTCGPCLAAHRLHNRVKYAQAKMREVAS